MSDYLLGMDVGTTNIKAILFDTAGEAMASASATYPLLMPQPGRAEQNALDWWQGAVEILQSITRQAGPEMVREIRGICISSHFPSLLPLDRQGEPLRNAIIWMDKRAGGELEEILHTVGESEYVAGAGGRPDATFLPCKLLWYRRNEPELFRRTYRVLQANGYLNYKLTGVMAMDMDQASLCQCMDLRTMGWSDTLSRATGVDFNAILPQPVPSGQIIGQVTPQAAALTGLTAGIPVVAGASDCTASMYATGLSQLGQAGESAGTTSMLFVGHTRPTPMDIPVVAKPCSIQGIPYFFNAPVTSSGASIKWYLNTLGQADSQEAAAQGLDVYDYLNRQALKAPAGSNGLIFFPYMQGERAPLWNSYARGMFIGLNLDTQRTHIIRSIFEGTAFSVRHVLETIAENGAQVHSLRITGGGAKSRTWCQIKASVLKVPVYTLEDKTGDVPFGDALLLGHALGIFPDFAQCIRRFVKVKECIQPVEEWSRVYDQLYPYYLDLYRRLDGDLRAMQETMREL